MDTVETIEEQPSQTLPLSQVIETKQGESGLISPKTGKSAKSTKEWHLLSNVFRTLYWMNSQKNLKTIHKPV